MVPSGWNLVRLHAVRMLPSGPANETACGQEYASLRAGVDWEDLGRTRSMHRGAGRA
jgi:hypothetical protein